MKFIKNISVNTPLNLVDEISYQKGQIVSKTIAQKPSHNLTLFAFDKDEEISTHQSDGDAMVTVLDGVAKITIGSEEYEVSAGQTICMPSQIPHAVYAKERLKMILLVLFQ